MSAVRLAISGSLFFIALPSVALGRCRRSRRRGHDARGRAMTPPPLRGTSPLRGEEGVEAQPPFFLASARIFSISSLFGRTSSPLARVPSLRRLNGYLG